MLLYFAFIFIVSVFILICYVLFIFIFAILFVYILYLKVIFFISLYFYLFRLSLRLLYALEPCVWRMALFSLCNTGGLWCSLFCFCGMCLSNHPNQVYYCVPCVYVFFVPFPPIIKHHAPLFCILYRTFCQVR